jgi:hypothetical protein
MTPLDVATLGATALTLYVAWRWKIRPIWVNRRRPLRNPPVREPWVNPKVRWPA